MKAEAEEVGKGRETFSTVLKLDSGLGTGSREQGAGSRAPGAGRDEKL
jgi:hypothetical protein